MVIEQWFEAHIWFAYLLLFLAVVVPGLVVWYQHADGRVWYKPWAWRCCWCHYECNRGNRGAVLFHKREEVLKTAGRLKEWYPGEKPEQLSKHLLMIERKWMLEVFGN